MNSTDALAAATALLNRIAAGETVESAELAGLACDSPRDCVDRAEITWRRRREPDHTRYDTPWEVAEWLASRWDLQPGLPAWWGDPCVGVGRLVVALWARLAATLPPEQLPGLRRSLVLNDPDLEATTTALLGVRSVTARRCVLLHPSRPDLARALAEAELTSPPPTHLCAVERLDALPKGGFVLTNPPFLSIRAMHRRLGPEAVARYRASSPLCRGAFDLGVPIVAACLRRVGPAGLAMVVPATWASAAYAEGLRHALRELGAWEHGPVAEFDAAVHTLTLHGPLAPDAARAPSPLTRSTTPDPGGLRPLGELVSVRGGTPGFDAAAVSAGLREASDAPNADAWPFLTTARIESFRTNQGSVRFARRVWRHPVLLRDAVPSPRRAALYDAPKVVVTSLDRRIRAAWVESPCALGIGLLAIPHPEPLPWLLALLNARATETLLRLSNPGSQLSGPWRRLDAGRLRALLVPPPELDVVAADLPSLDALVMRAGDDEEARAELDRRVWRWYEAAAPADLFERMLGHRENP